jgi:hypothetical protein
VQLTHQRTENITFHNTRRHTMRRILLPLSNTNHHLPTIPYHPSHHRRRRHSHPTTTLEQYNNRLQHIRATAIDTILLSTALDLDLLEDRPASDPLKSRTTSEPKYPASSMTSLLSCLAQRWTLTQTHAV